MTTRKTSPAKAAASKKKVTKAASKRKDTPAAKNARLLQRFRRSARAVSVFGPFGSKTLVEMPTDLASALFGQSLAASGRTNAIDAVERDLEVIRQHAPGLADSATAATALRMAYELENPYTSATAKSMCARSLLQAVDRLLELAPEEGGEDGLDALAARIAKRRAGSAD